MKGEQFLRKYPRFRRSKTSIATMPELLERFIHRLVTVKTSEGFAVEGSIWRVDPNDEHYQPIGNLILANRTIIRGNYVSAICTARREEP